MTDLPHYTISPRQVLGRVSVIIGKSGSGKTTVVKDFINSISNDISQAFIISSTAAANGDYNGILPQACIHKTIRVEFLKELQERQEVFRAIYDRVNRPELIDALYRRSATSKVIAKVTKISETVAGAIADEKAEGNSEENIKKLTGMRDDLISAIKKKTIFDNSARLLSAQLTEDERYCVEHINFNPNVLLVFDDCTSEIESLRGAKELKELFYASRHRMITILMIVHTDRALLGDLKKSAVFIVLTDQPSANSFFDRKTNDIDGETRKRAKVLIKTVIGTANDPIPHRFQRLVFSDGSFYKYTAKVSPPRLILPDILQKFCEEIEKSRGNGLAGNKYAKLLEV